MHNLMRRPAGCSDWTSSSRRSLPASREVTLLPDDRTPELEIVALYPHRRHLSTKVRLFLDMLVDRFAEEQRWLDATPDR